MGKILVNANADIDATSYFGETALMIAAWDGHLEILKFLLEENANIDKTDDNGDTALMKAARSYWGTLEIVNYLLNRNAKIDIKKKKRSRTSQIYELRAKYFFSHIYTTFIHLNEF